MNKRILIIASEAPFPANHGGRKDILARVKYFKKNFYNVDLLCTVSSSDEAKELKKSNLFSNIYLVKRKSNLKSIFKSALYFKPMQVVSRDELKNIEIHNSYEKVFFEGDYVIEALKNKTIFAKEKIFRVHNVESKYFLSLYRASNFLPEKLYYLFEALMFKFIEPVINSSFDKYWFISSKEYESSIINKNKKKWVPPPQELKNPLFKAKFKHQNSCNLLIIGNLFMVNNIEGIKWYFEHVHRMVLKKHCNLKVFVVGNGKGKIPKELLAIKESFPSSIIIEEGVSDERLLEVYSNSYIFLNVMLNGAGLKLKTVDAISSSCSVISTQVGNEGTGLVDKKHLIIANTAEEFSEAIDLFINKPNYAYDLAENAFNFISENYDIDSKIKNPLC